jgi:predicted alpha/beta superfamily hydrolase
MQSFFAAFLTLVVASSDSFSQTLTIRVHAPANTPDSASVYVAGNLPELGNWRADGVSMTRDSRLVWSAKVQPPRGIEAEFKITLGSWQKEALYAVGVIPENIRVRVDADTTVDLFPVTWNQPGEKPTGGITGTVRYHRGILGRGLKYPRDVIVWLPPSYDSTAARRYPVLYMQDGQNAFDPTTSFSGYDWQVDEVADSLIRCGALQEILIVAIGNSPDRLLEYSDTTLGRAYASFVVDELKPFIDSTYRTKPDRANTAAMGSSLGGLISFLFVWWHPEAFSKAACLSSPFRWDHNRIFHDVEAAKRAPSGIAVYLDCGTAGPEGELIPVSTQMHKLLKRKGLVEGKTLMRFVDNGAEHNEWAWAKRVWRPLEFFFPKITE